MRSVLPTKSITAPINQWGPSEIKLAERLIDELSKDKFESNQFEDTYREKDFEIAEQKAHRGRLDRLVCSLHDVIILLDDLKTGA
jgi:non-homologous end joining protein Ku